MIRSVASALLGLALLQTAGCAYGAARARDFADCFRASAGYGLGLTASVQVTDWFSPGVGAASHTWNYGYLDRDVWGAWVESGVIQTPRLAYEGLAIQLSEQSREQMDEGGVLTRLALDSLNLPSERWVRTGSRVRVERYALINLFQADREVDASWLAGFLVEPGDVVLAPVKDVWQSTFVELGGTLVAVHGRIGFSPLQCVDFFAGLFGFDPAGDDGRAEFYEFERVHPLGEAGRLDGP
ncbi:MAG: hypothetical protein ACO4CT_01280 [Planctomycetota bacterium]|jgi:hypothetical protein